MVLCRELIARVDSMGVTFHRAFDTVRAPARALEQVIELGCERLLTSGATTSAERGAQAIAALVAQADERIRIMAGAGLTADNVADVARLSRAHEFHASAKHL